MEREEAKTRFLPEGQGEGKEAFRRKLIKPLKKIDFVWPLNYCLLLLFFLAFFPV